MNDQPVVTEIQRPRQWWIAAIVLFIAALMWLAFGLLALPAGATPGAQDNIPTPTLFPVEDVAYTLDTVGGQDETLTFPGAEEAGITTGDTTVRSEYPLGMVFAITPESANGAIDSVMFYIRFMPGQGTRLPAEWDAAAGAWIAHPWATGNDQPAWTPFEFYWRVHDTGGAAVETPPHAVEYFDPTREWYRMQSPYISVYWFGMDDIPPERFAYEAAYAVAATRQRRVDGFGRPLSYVSRCVIYATHADMGEISAGGIIDPTAGGYTINGLGMSVLHVPEIEPEGQVGWLRHGITHELTHLYQFDVVGGATGPVWWMEGQAEWFSFEARRYDGRLRELVMLQDLPTLTHEVTRNLPQADGQIYLVYDIGASFINWLVAQHGIETHAAVVALMRQNTSLYEALEEVTGQPFLDIENAWRAYLGLPPFSPADLDPLLALEPAIDPLFAAGAEVQLPASPALVMLYAEPGPNTLAIGQCFGGTEVTILGAGSLDGVDYYEVDCLGQTGWMTRDQLAGTHQGQHAR